MGNYTILKNSTLTIEASADYQDNGWSFSNGVAIHNDCNSGSFENMIFQPDVGKLYELKFTVASLSGGTVKVSLGGIELDDITESGAYSISVLTEDSSFLRFWSDANVIISAISISEGKKAAMTLLFDYDNKQFVGESSYNGDFAGLFIDNMISFKNGNLWIHDKNSERNTYYGVKYDSVVEFYVNTESNLEKDFISIALEGNGKMRADVSIVSKEGKESGQMSRIKKNNFKLYKGTYKADFLRDMNDPRFATPEEALFKGAQLQGKILKVRLTNDSHDNFELASVDVFVSIK